MATERPTRYGIRSTSRRSAVVDPYISSLREDEDGGFTRRLVDATIVRNDRMPEASVKITLRHQRRNRRTGEWEDAGSFNLRHLDPGEEVRLALDSRETLMLFKRLGELYAIGQEGVPMGERTLIVADAEEATVLVGREREVLEQLISANGPGLWDLIESIQPDLLTAAHAAKVRQERMQAVSEFETHLAAGDWAEPQWQTFFEDHAWIFGSGLALQFLHLVQAQAHYGGMAITGRGDQRGDYLMASAATVKFSLLVEIKRPDTPLVAGPYRNDVYQLGSDLIGGASQLQTNCRTWAQQATNEANIEAMREAGVETVQPRGILVIGDTSQLDSAARVRTFELYRQNLANPEIVTFDELLERARFIADAPRADGTT